jgi:heme-degrading monooxygenase HmoA
VPARFVLEIGVLPGFEEDLMRAYDALRARLERGVPGLLGHELCQSVDDPGRWILTSKWESLEASAAWDRSEEHDRLVRPLRECFERAASTKYLVRAGVTPRS